VLAAWHCAAAALLGVLSALIYMFHPSNESAVPSAKAGGTSVHKKAFDNSAATTDSVVTKVPTLEVCTQVRLNST
jgi:hypothetical protein